MAQNDWDVVSTEPATAVEDSGWGVVSQTPVAPTTTATSTPVAPTAPAAAPTPVPREPATFAPGEEFGKGVKGAYKVGIPSGWENLKLAGSSEALSRATNQLALLDKIDKGEVASPRDLPNDPRVRMYYASNPEVRQKLRSSIQTDWTKSADLTNASLELVQKYQQEAEKYKGRTEKLLDAEGVADFTNWLAKNMGAVAVYAVPSILSAVAFKQPGLLTFGTGVAYSEAVGERLKHLEKQTAGMQPEQKAEAVADYLRKTNDVNLAVAVASGALDVVLGPAASLLKKSAKEIVQAATRKGAAKQALKEIPKQMGEEAVAGAGQQAAQIKGGVALGEKEKFWTPENVKDIIESSASEAFGSILPTAAIGAVRTAATPSAPAKTEERKEPTIEGDEWEVKSTSPKAETKTEPKMAPPAPQAPGLPKLANWSDVALQSALDYQMSKPETVTSRVPVTPDMSAEERAQANKQNTPRNAALVQAIQAELDRRAGKETPAAETPAAETPAAETPAPAAPTTTSKQLPPEVTDLVQKFRKMGYMRDDALRLAEQQLAEQIKPFATPQAQTQPPAPPQGAENVGTPVTPPGGASTEVVAQPDTGTSAPGAGGPPRVPLVPAGQDVTEPSAREAGKPATVAEEQTTTPETETTSGVETPEAVQAEAQGQEAPAAAAPVKNRPGPKPPTEQKKTERDAARRADRAERGRHDRAVRDAEQQLTKALEPLNEGEFADEESLKEALQSQRSNRVGAIATLLRVSEEAGAKPAGKRARKALRDANISEKELAPIRAGIRLRKSATKENVLSAEEAPVDTTPDLAFKAATNGVQAIGIVARTGNMFERILANRIRAFLTNVKFVVIEEGDALPETLQKENVKKHWDRARGIFVSNTATGERTVYVRGASFGADNGINNTVVLHEMLHAATNKKLELALAAIQGGYSLNSPLVRTYNDLIRVMNNAGSRFNELAREGKVPPRISQIAKVAFDDPREFLAYGMSDPDFQDFLKTARGFEADTSFFRRFVNDIREFFGMAEDDINALSDLVVVTDKLLSARKTPEMRIVESGERRAAQLDAVKVSEAAKKNAKQVNKAERKVKLSESVEDTLDDMGALTSLRDPKLFLDVMGSAWKGMKIKSLEALLPALQTNMIAEWANNLGINHVAAVWQQMQDMNVMRTKMMSNASDIVQDWVKLQTGLIGKALGRKNEMRDLAAAMHYSTDKAIDPTKDKTDPTLNAMWNKLSDPAKAIYIKVRDFYKSNFDLYRALLQDRIDKLKVPGDPNDPDTPRGRLMAEIKKIYETGKKLAPYFPLMRYGDYWLRIGSGQQKEFYMFESPVAREMYLKKRLRQLQAAGDTRTEEEMRTDEFIEDGNDLRVLRDRSSETAPLLKSIFGLIGDPANGLSPDEVEALKDQIYQLYLATMPEPSFRRQFIHRKGTAGYSGDALRNFVTSSINMSNQLARIKYGPMMMDTVEAARDSLKGNPDKARLQMLVDEVGLRAKEEAYPKVTNDVSEAVANIANRSAFLYFMTSVKTALVQLSSLPVFGAPVLFSRHNPVDVVTEMGKLMVLFNDVGVMDTKKGITSWSVSDIGLANSRRVSRSAEDQRAIEEMHERGIAEVTMTYDLMDRRKTPTTKYIGAAKTATNMMGALFHHAERLNREIMFMTSFRLSRKAGMSFDEAIDQAVKDTHDALGNFTAANRPRVMRGPVGRTLLQFKTFPAFVTSYLIRNAYRMFKGVDADAKKEAATQLFGTLFMSGMLAGYVGIPGISMAMGVAEGLIEMFRSEDDDDPLEKRDLETWFRNVFIRDMFGEAKIGDHKISDLLNEGVLDELSGYKISDSLSMNNMWFPELKEQATAQATMQDYALSMMGPSASLFLKQIPSAVDDFNKGKLLQGFEKLLPGLFRNVVKSYRYGEEGVTSGTGAPIKESNEFTRGQLIAQAAGFRTQGLANAQEDNFKAEALRQKVVQKKAELVSRLDLEAMRGDDEAFDKALEKLLVFGEKNPTLAMKPKEMSKALETRMENRATADRGFRVDKKLYPLLEPLLERSREQLDKEAVKAAKK